MANKVSVLDVSLHGKPIGTLTLVGGDRSLFAFHRDYIDDTTRPTLGLGFKDSLGNLITDFRPVQTRVMPFFSNLLPEGRMRDYLAARAGVNPQREFFLLWVLGEDLPGAVTIAPSNGEAWPPDTNDGQEPQHVARETALRFSLAGVQLKFSAVRDSRKGLTIPANGVGGSWIVKLPSREFSGVPENEYSMMTLARLVGIDVPPIDLVEIGAISNLPKGVETLEGPAFAIERFDRRADGSRLHIEDFAQVFDVYPDKKYRGATYRRIAEVIGIEGRDTDVAECIRRLTFNMLIGNADMHLKNWSLIYPDKRNVALAPAYDFVATIAYIPDSHAALKISRSARFDDFTEDELAHLAATARLPEKLVVQTALETVERFHDKWKTEKANLPLSKRVIDAIDAHLAIVPLGRRRTVASAPSW